MKTRDPKNNDEKIKWKRESAAQNDSDASLAPSWLSYHYGKMLIAGVVVIILAFTAYMIIDNN